MHRGKTGWFLFRAVLALAFLAGFYALAIGMAAPLFWIPYATVVYAHQGASWSSGAAA